jgi:pantoate--beta-alanine ligase
VIRAESVSDTRDWRRGLHGSVGLVPTMGYLHAGHLSLVQRARADNDHVAVSIFVNPTQFGPNEDLAAYPRNMAGDLAQLAQAGVDVVFMPEAGEIYPPDFDTWVEPGAIAERLEGAARPGHFRGVATVVLKLLNIVRPDRAYFGEKDAQQLRVIQKLVRDLDVGVEIVPMPTIREADGLAMSSRNAYLSADERRAALVLSRGLFEAVRLWRGGVENANALRGAVADMVAAEPLATLDYVSLADGATLVELEQLVPNALLSLAARIGTTRLIDNVVLCPVVDSSERFRTAATASAMAT